MSQKRIILRRIAIILLAIISPTFVQAQLSPSAKSLPYKYGFETTLVAGGWTVSNPEGSAISAAISSDYHRGGSKSFVFSADAVEAPATTKTAYLISPELSVTAASHLVFYYRKNDDSHTSSFQIGYSTTDTDPEHFGNWSDVKTDATTSFKSYAYELPTGVKYVALKFESSTSSAMSLILDDFIFTNATCGSATNFRCTSRLSKTNGVRLEWKDNSDGYATYQIKKGDELIATLDRGVTSYTFSDALALDKDHTYTLTTICGNTPLENPLTVTFTTVTGPKVEGYVCGGARMSDVNGSSRVIVVNCEHLYAVYGGNDITGEVKGQSSHYDGENPYTGAEVKVGTENTEQVLIDYVYGGGSGLYYYPGIGTGTTQLVNKSQTTLQEIKYVDGTPLDARSDSDPDHALAPSNGALYNRVINQDTVPNELESPGVILGYYGTDNGFSTFNYNRDILYATVSADGEGNYPTIPKVDHTRIIVNSDNVYIDSIFGGAENAQVGRDVVNPNAPADTSVSITVNKGTVFALFGGNNYGGLLGKGTYQHIVVNGTSKNTESSLALGGDKAHGKSHYVSNGVYSLYKESDILAHGIRYLFGGGNDVMARNVHVEIKGGQIDTLFAGGNSAGVASTTVDVNVVVNKVNPSANKSLYTSYNESQTVFDIRCLFGGNNDANMYTVPTLNITSGGIHTLYGGGNNGLMLGGEEYADNDAVYAAQSAEPPVEAAANATRSTKIKINGSVVVDTIYGGGQSAGTLNDTYIHLIAGTYGTVFGGTNILGNIGYQGTDGLGRNSSGTLYAKTNILVDKDGYDYVYIKKALFGGSNGYYMCPDITGSVYSNTPMVYNDDSYAYLAGMSTPSVWQTNIWLRGGYLEGSVYGGGNLATVGKMYNNDVTLRSEGNTKILITGCEMADGNRAIFGGSNYANVYGNTTINIVGDYDDFDNDRWYPNIAANIYGGNDKAGTVTGGPSRTDSYSSVASDDTKISWDSLPSYMTTENSYSIAQNHKVALNQNNAASYISIQGFVGLNNVFGGGNGAYNYYKWNNSGNPDYDYNGDGNPDNIASLTNTALFFDGKMIMPNQTSSFVDIHVDLHGADGTIPYVYAGGNYASVGEDMTIGSKTFAKGLPTVWLNSATRNSVDYSKSDLPEVDYIFGGNNHVNMSAVPRIYLLKGDVGEVYGGGNEGGMTGSRDLAFASSYSVPGVSTCVMVVSDESDVKNNIFGGCNVDSVTNDTYVGIRRGTVTANVFGGNNISGDVPVSHVDIFGSDVHPVTVYGEVFGGGKGDYEYANNGHDRFDVNTSTTEGNITHYGVASRPYTELTNVRVENSASTVSAAAVTIYGNIYGGGLAGGCRETLVDINAPDGIFDCMIFGGGKGIVSQIGNANSRFDGYAQAHAHEGTKRTHAGNIHSHTSALASTNVHIRQMKSMNIDASSHRHAIFGGGYSGDVDGDTYVHLYPTNKATIPAVYLGGVAADVTGTATGLFEGGVLTDTNANNIDTIYGGNDFTGKVYATDITINSGVYQHVFGGGNGDYVYKDVLSLTSAPNEEQQSAGYCTTQATDGRYWKFGCGDDPIIDSVPYSMKVDVVFNGGTFRGNVYGGGNLGLVGNRDMKPINMDPDNVAYSESLNYANLGRIHVVINDGDFKRHVFGGARGKSRLKGRFFNTATGTHNNIDGSPLGRHLVYGIKQVDMYGGNVYFSLHGGSESVDDGYPFECKGPTYDNTNYYKNLADRVRYDNTYANTDDPRNPNSTLRPSSIVNIIGGHVRKSLYGGGYKGNIYGSVFVNIGAQAIKDSPVWRDFADMRIDDDANNTIASLKPSDALLVPATLNLDASVYNCADWGEAGDKAYFNTRGVFGGETDIIIDGEGYNTTGTPTYSGSDPDMNIAFSVIGAGTSTEGGDINRLIVMRNYGSYVCPKPLKSLYSIQRADKVVLDKVYINLYGEQDAFESYASPNFSLNRIDTLALCNDNVLNIESPANYIGLHASLKNITDVYHLYEINGSNPNLVKNIADPSDNHIATTSENLASNDILDNQVEATCTAQVNGCEKLDVCALVPTNRGDRGLPGKFNTIIVDEGSYVKISPFVDVYDLREAVDANGNGDYSDEGDVAPVSGRDGVDDNDDAWGYYNDHVYGHVFGYTYLVAPLETMGYVYGAFKTNSNNQLDGGFVSPCTCNNSDGTIEGHPETNEIFYTNVTTTGLYRTWKIGTTNGLRKRSATLIANKEPDNILNWSLADGTYTKSLNNHNQVANGYTVSNENNFAYATATIELPPAKEGNFYIVETIEIDQANGGEMRLIDEGYEAISNSVFQAWNNGTATISTLADSSQNLRSIATGDHNLSFGLTMSSISSSNSAGRVTNFAPYGTCWTGTTPTGLDHPLYEVTTESGPRDIAVYITDVNNVRTRTNNYHHCWPITSISGGAYFNEIGGYISNAVVGSGGAVDGILPRITLTLTYDTRITNTIARDVKFRMLEYDKYGHYVGPIDVTVTINTVIRNFSDIEAPVLAMYNGGIDSLYVRRVNIPASFIQRDLYLEDIKWERNTDSRILGDRFYLQSMDDYVTQSNQFAIQISPVEMVSNTLNNHLGWYDIVQGSRNIDIYKIANEDLNRRTNNNLSSSQSANYTSWDINQNDSEEQHYDGDMPSYSHDAYTGNTWGDANGSEWYDNRISSSSLHGREGIKLGTLNGRAPATLDVTLKYNGSLTDYHDHYADDDPGPLAWAYLKLHWYNTNTEDASGSDDGVFWVKVKLRTREKGDTIYMAPGTTLTRQTVEGNSLTMHNWYSSPERDQASTTVLSNATHIRNNPNMYVNTFPQALSIYQEGDVLDIMDTIIIDGNSNPLSVGNSDHVGIQIIRYSGSHYKFPSLGCANPKVMVKVKRDGRIAFRNIRFNGSGATRVKARETTPHSNNDSVTTIATGQYYNASADRIKAIYFAESPILQCDDGGQLSLANDVSLINNFNKASYGTSGFVGGGAIAITNGGIVTMGDNTEIRDNFVVNNGSIKNYGGAVYVDNGIMRVGPQVEDAECDITIEHNYNYMGSNVSNVLNETVPANLPVGFKIAETHAYSLDTSLSASLKNNFSLSNVYLTRKHLTVSPTSANATEVANILKVRGDSQNDRIQFTGALSKGSRIGVSKWFPGYPYTSTGSSSLLDNTVPRDTVSIAVLTGSTKSVLAEQNFTNNVFFNDSNYFAQTSGTRAFITNNDYTEYHDATAAFPAYNDQVNTFYHNYVDDKTIYLHRCASFGKGVSKQQLAYTISGSSDVLKCDDYAFGDSIAFRMNPDATCMAITDTIVFKVGGGFFPYTYHWDYDSVIKTTPSLELYRKSIRDRQTYDPNSISNLDIPSYAAKRLAAERDTLVLYALEERQTLLQSTYFFQATATDAAGCAVTQPVMVRVAKNHESEQILDNGNFLLYDDDVNDNDYYEVTSSVDSSYFHGRHHNTSTGFTGSSTITPSYKLLDGSDDPNAASYASYSGNYVPRYMRTYHSYKVTPQVMPALADDVIEVSAYTTAGGTELHLDVDLLCPGSMIYLTPVKPANSKWEYMSWDFDPSTGENTTFVVSNDPNRNKPTVYYAPNDYWWQAVNTYYNDDADHGEDAASRLDYVTDYYGDVTIKTEKGLAWLISRVNGYNGQSARTFHFNTITLDLDPSLSGKLDMGKHKWTPLGNQTNPFEGTFVGNGNVISNIIVNEEVLPLVGMFGYTDSADISNFILQDVQMKGNSYIGSLIAHANNSDIKQVNVDNGILFSEYVVGGLIAKADNTTYIDEVVVSQDVESPVADEPGGDPVAVQRSPLKVKGNAIYFGGICGQQNAESEIRNSGVNEINQDYLSALYSGPLVGSSDGVPSNNGKAEHRNKVENCYAHIKSTGNAERLGGLVGRAEAIDMANCYVYGEAKATDFTGALAGYVGNNVDISNCYYVDGLTNEVVGYGAENAVTKSTSFRGQGKQVLLTSRVDGYNNLLRALNGWVDRQEDDTNYLHWRPAVGSENGGYPLFGVPEMIEVFDTFSIATCDSYDFDGITLTQSGTYTMHFVDSTDYLDSTVTIMLTINYGDTVEVVDTVLLGQGYEGYGISLTAEQVSAAFGSDHSVDIRAMMYIDSLLNANGCDSLIMLTLFIVNNNSDIDNSQFTIHDSQVKIYPNPTRGMVTVEGSGLLSVEVYDNISRRILEKSTDGKAESLRFDMTEQASGSYYIRVKTTHGAVVKKLIKK